MSAYLSGFLTLGEELSDPQTDNSVCAEVGISCDNVIFQRRPGRGNMTYP